MYVKEAWMQLNALVIEVTDLFKYLYMLDDSEDIFKVRNVDHKCISCNNFVKKKALVRILNESEWLEDR